MKFPEAPWEKEWREFEEDHMCRPRSSSFKGGEMEKIMPNGDLHFEDANDGIIILAPQNISRATWEYNQKKRFINDEETPWVAYEEEEHGQTRNNG